MILLNHGRYVYKIDLGFAKMQDLNICARTKNNVCVRNILKCKKQLNEKDIFSKYSIK